MAKVTNIKRLDKVDFSKEDHNLVDRLAFVINPLSEQIVNAFNKNIDFENLNQEFINLETQVDVNGRPTMNFELRNPLRTKPRGICCVGAQNLSDNTLLTGAPFILFTVESNIIRIAQITGLPAGKRFNLSIILIG